MIKKLRRTVPEDDADDNEYQSSCKLKIILKLLERFDGLHRVLIFSQTREMLDAIEAFKEEGGDPIFLISSLSGGTGLDLPVASRTIIVEPAWNPCIDDQCTDRIYRLGQLKDVIIYRLITSETIEEHVYRKQLFKASIFKAATEQKNFKRYVIKQMRSEFFKLPPNGFSISRTQKMLEKETMHGVLPQEVKKELRFLEKQGTAGVTIHNKLFAETIDVPVCKSHESYQLRSGTKQQPHGGYSSAAVKKGAEFVVKSRFAFEPEDDAAAARKARESRIKYLEGEVKRLTYNYVANGIKLPDRGKNLLRVRDKHAQELAELQSDTDPKDNT